MRLYTLIAIAALALAPRLAAAQAGSAEAERPPHGFAPPSDDPPPGSEAATQTPTSGEHGGHHLEDPSEYFNFFGMDYKKKDLTGGQLGDGKMVDPKTGVQMEEEPKSAPFIFMVLNFALLLYLLAKLGGPAARKAAADRHDQIKTALDEAAKLRKLAADKLAEYNARLKDADAQITALVEGMRADAEADKARIIATAEAQAVQMKRDAELRIAAEIEGARALLTREVTAAAIAATEQLLRDQMKAADQKQLVGAFIADLQAPSKEVR